MSLRPVAACVLLAAVPVLAQSPRRFEVASIRPTEPDANTPGSTLGIRVTGTQIRTGGLSLKDYVGMAYSMDPPQVIAPDWTRDARFEISANLPPGGTREQLPEMLRTLLIERFQLRVHEESRSFPIYALTVGKDGLKVKRTPIDPTAPPPAASEMAGAGANNGVVIAMGAGTWTLADNKLDVRQLTMAEIANGLTRFSERKTLDMTGIADRVDFTLELSQEDFGFAMMRAAFNNGYAVGPQALKVLDLAPSNLLGPYLAEFGLALEERIASLPVVVVDAVSKVPTDN